MEKLSTEEKAHVQYCPDCGSKNIIRDYDTSETVCSECGFVLPEKIFDHGPERRAFDDEQRRERTRTGAPLTYTIHDKGLSTMIDWHDRDYSGKGFSPGQKAQYYRLRKWQRRIRVSNATERNLAFALSDIDRTANKLGVPKNIIESASLTYRKAVNGKPIEVFDKKTKQKKIVNKSLVRGRSIKSVSAAALYISCREAGLPRTLEEIAEAVGVSKKDVARSYRFLFKELDRSPTVPKPSSYVSKFSNQLTMQGKAEEIVYKTIEELRKLRYTSGKDPRSIAAATSYIASVLTGERKTQREIAEIGQITEVTIRNRYQEIFDKIMFRLTV